MSDVRRVIVHQFDPARPSPGGIDTCLRGVCRYAPQDDELFVVGVDTGTGPAGRELGVEETHTFGARTIRFLPVARFDPADQNRRIPHSARLVAGVAKYIRRIPPSDLLQAHRADTAYTLSKMLRRPLSYFIHTQENGLTGTVSDSFWKRAGGVHQGIERSVVKAAQQVVVFNEEYASTVREWNPSTISSPTWYDPAILAPAGERDAHAIVWVGRLEYPKDPLLALSAFARLIDDDPDTGWSLRVLGSGTMSADMQSAREALPASVRDRIRLEGRVAPEEVVRIMGSSGTFLMTSHPGYEGYPRVLVEAMASGLRPVVTSGSDTGGLVDVGRTGFVTDRDPTSISAALRRSLDIERATVISRVAGLSAPDVVGRIFADVAVRRTRA